MEKIYDLMWLVNDYEQLKGRIWKFEFIFDSYFMSRHDEKIEYIKIISKSYWFIERLVENDKIDFDKKDYPLRYNSYYPDRFWIVSIGVDDYEEYLRVDYDRCETLLMLLAISDTPIEDLISYLKE